MRVRHFCLSNIYLVIQHRDRTILDRNTVYAVANVILQNNAENNILDERKHYENIVNYVRLVACRRIMFIF